MKLWPQAQLPPHATKHFGAALLEFNRRLQARQPFSLVRFGDGEMMIIQGKAIDLFDKYNGEHRYVPGAANDEQQRTRLTASLHYQNPRYFVGIACPCCVGRDNFHQLKSGSGQADEQLTWANLFVNSNYRVFLQQTVPLLQQMPVNLVCHQRADPSGLPFSVGKTFRTGANAWVNDYQRVHDELDQWVASSASTNEVFLFCAGVLSNILVKEMTQRHPGHTYIDLGSVFDTHLGLGATRSYLKSGFFRRKRKLNKTCVWE